MRTAFGTLTAMTLVASVGIAIPAALAADPPADDEREEIIITHSKLGPLSDWARMQAHNAE